MIGKSDDDTTGNSYRYIEKYAEEMELSPHRSCMRVLAETEKVLHTILNGDPGKNHEQSKTVCQAA